MKAEKYQQYPYTRDSRDKSREVVTNTYTDASGNPHIITIRVKLSGEKQSFVKIDYSRKMAEEIHRDSCNKSGTHSLLEELEAEENIK